MSATKLTTVTKRQLKEEKLKRTVWESRFLLEITLGLGFKLLFCSMHGALPFKVNACTFDVSVVWA